MENLKLEKWINDFLPQSVFLYIYRVDNFEVDVNKVHDKGLTSREWRLPHIYGILFSLQTRSISMF